MAPDKIYLSVAPNEDWKYAIWSERPLDGDKQAEYIRKDALAEWLKNQMSFEQGYSTGEAERAYRFALNDVIDKINTL